jgi:methylase of polypeptide subunit release factors
MKKLCAMIVTVCILSIGFVSAMVDYREEIPFVPTPIEVVDRMLELAEVKKGDIIYDLGSGDGRIVIRAAKNMGPAASVSRWTRR